MIEVWGGFALGLIGSLHCAGMCGPIAFALPYDRSHWFKAILGNYLYQFGRIITYTILGLLIGLVGRGFSFAGLSQWLSIIVGVAMILAVVIPRIPFFNQLNMHITMSVSKVKQWMGLFIQKRGNSAFFMTGLVNGLLPCGLVYMGLLGALGTGESMKGAYFMFMFGLGTFPMMFLLGWSGSFLTNKLRQQFQKLVPVLVVAIGILFVLRGMGLGIKYISPAEGALSIEQTEQCH